MRPKHNKQHGAKLCCSNWLPVLLQPPGGQSLWQSVGIQRTLVEGTPHTREEGTPELCVCDCAADMFQTKFCFVMSALLLLQATFVVEVAAPSHMAVLSNTLPASTTNSSDGSVKSVRFLPTPPMSTYLLSIAVGELAAVSAHSDRCVRLNKNRQPLAQQTDRTCVCHPSLCSTLCLVAFDYREDCKHMSSSSTTSLQGLGT